MGTSIVDGSIVADQGGGSGATDVTSQVVGGGSSPPEWMNRCSAAERGPPRGSIIGSGVGGHGCFYRQSRQSVNDKRGVSNERFGREEWGKWAAHRGRRSRNEAARS